ncbi:MAG TPA: homoserine dehydrogenase [Candidatus Limnocylindrales bacterium]|nr:homoserine dehydrogenase [Candidatus Limnocylindrales bacterium]
MRPSSSGTGPRLRIGLIGWGTVGSALGALIAGGPLPVDLVRIDVLDAERERASKLQAGVPVSSADELVAADDLDVVVELAGGVDGPRAWAGETLRRRAYVTANKAVLATHGSELAEIAAAHGTALLGSASVGGGTPMIEMVEHLAATGRIRSLRGLLNATTTFILSAMAEGRSYAEALAEAQRAGYAEADPTFDVEGRDAAQKLAILASVAWGRWRAEREVDTRGIVGVPSPPGRTIRLLGTGDQEGLRVGPTELPAGSVLASASGVESVLEIALFDGELFRIFGPGAGGRVTAGAVCADLARLVAGERPILFGSRAPA